MKKYLFLGILIAIMGSCKEKEPRTSLFGSWNVAEINEMTGVQRTYLANIVRDRIDSSIYLIYNFHNIGNDQNVAVRFYEDNEGYLIMENQLIEGTNAWVQGKGTVEAEYEGIQWVYVFNDGIEQNAVANYY